MSIRPMHNAPQPPFNPGYAHGTPVAPVHHQPAPPPMAPGYDPRAAAMNTPTRPGMPPPPAGAASSNAYNPPRPPEVFTIADDEINRSIPEQVRNQFQRDETGRVLFFTAPPGQLENNGLTKRGAALGHTSRYLDGLDEWRAERERKRKERDERLTEEASKKRIVEEKLALEQKEAALEQTADLLAGYFKSHAEVTKQMMGRENGTKSQTKAQEAR